MAYLAPIHRPSSVRHAIKLSFLTPDSDDLIVAKANRLEIYTPNPQNPDQLSLHHSKSLYGKVTLLQKLRPATSQTDHLFVGTDRYHYFTLSWDATTKQLKTEKSYVDIAEKASRDSQTGDRVTLDPTNRFLALECHEGVINILPLTHAGKGKRKASDNAVGELQDPVPVRIPDLNVRSTCFLHKRQAGAKQANPELALLHEDPAGNRVRLNVRELEFSPSLRPQEEPPTVELEKVREVHGGELELGASHLIPLPAPMYGLLVVGETSICYVDEWDYRITATQPLAEATVFVAWCAVDDQRYVLADDYGKLYLLFIQQTAQGEYAGHELDVLGQTSRASTLVYLDAGRIFVGSHQGDSQLIQITPPSSPNTDSPSPSPSPSPSNTLPTIQILQTFANIAPILDFTIMDMGNRSSTPTSTSTSTSAESSGPVNEFSSGQARLVTGSGAYADGSLRSVRSGVGLEDLGSIVENMGPAPVSGLFGLQSTITNSSSNALEGGGEEEEAGFVDTLLVSFVSHTRVFHFAADGEVEELETFGGDGGGGGGGGGFRLDESTLYAGNLPDGRAVQVTSSAVRVTTTGVDANMVHDDDTWRPPSGTSITAVAASSTTLLVSLGGAGLVVLNLSGASGVQVQAQRDFSSNGSGSGSGQQISCIALSNAVPGLCIAGFWRDGAVALLDLHTLQPVLTERVADDAASPAVPRSLVVAKILGPGQPPVLFVGLADGTVVTYSLTPSPSPQQQPPGIPQLTARKSIILGTQHPNFALLPRLLGSGSSSAASGLENVFATCEHPSLIYGAEGRLVYSAVTASNAQSIASFDCEAYPGAIAIATASGELKLALVDEERTTHVQTLPVHETVRRIAYSPALKAFGLGTIKRTLTAGQEEVVSHFTLVDEIAFQPLHSYALGTDELIESVMRCQLDDGAGAGELAERFVVGTAYLDDAEQKSARGRILVFEVTEERRLKVVAELSLRGACRCLGMCEGRIVAGLVKTIVIFAFEYQTPSHPFLVKKATYRTATAPIDLSVSGAIIAVADLMKSVSLLEYKPGRAGTPDTLGEIARHFETLWGTAVAKVAENTYLEADAEGNLVVLQHDINGYSADDRRRLKPVSEMLLGEMVNRIRAIDVRPTANAVVIPRAFLATVEGSIYLFALIAPGKQDLLMRLQTILAARVKVLGHVPFNKWRGFRSQVRDMGEEGPMRFVDGEVIEAFLEADEGVQEEVCRELGGGVEVEEVRAMVEGLRRIH
ncbi:hypothetical protein LTR36_010983 [Oleoguttula mirabilis]|uniref:DNA damage-binding protein 1 n=1 Tax=Oleoguttula mirabilis TaxID=1507867 RepID=A0AAV9J3U4_9PEZI|nr:hypothetical protein LTR36_010983 [Oleoguttula mirabilis]